MKNITMTIAAATLLSLYGCQNGEGHKDASHEVKDTLAQTAKEEVKEEAPPMDSAAQAKAWENYMTPNDMHKQLAAFDGKWEGEQRSWMEEGGQPSPPVKMTAEYKMVLGGRYQDGVHKGNMMGMPFEGHSWTGYDNAKKKFVSNWIDNFGTGMMYSEGDWNEATKSLEMKGKMMDPTTGKEMDVRQVTKVIDDKHQVFEMYCAGKDGKEFKTMEISMTRK